jgi:hypothetical protein
MGIPRIPIKVKHHDYFSKKTKAERIDLLTETTPAEFAWWVTDIIALEYDHTKIDHWLIWGEIAKVALTPKKKWNILKKIEKRGLIDIKEYVMNEYLVILWCEEGIAGIFGVFDKEEAEKRATELVMATEDWAREVMTQKVPPEQLESYRAYAVEEDSGLSDDELEKEVMAMLSAGDGGFWEDDVFYTYMHRPTSVCIAKNLGTGDYKIQCCCEEFPEFKAIQQEWLEDRIAMADAKEKFVLTVGDVEDNGLSE